MSREHSVQIGKNPVLCDNGANADVLHQECRLEAEQAVSAQGGHGRGTGQATRYYVMDLDKGMAETVALEMPSPSEIAGCKWLTENELEVYTDEYERTGFQGGLDEYRCIFDAKQTAELGLFSDRTIDVPSLFIGGKSDWGVARRAAAVWVLVGLLLGLLALGGAAQAEEIPGVRFEEVRISNGSERQMIAGVWRAAAERAGHRLPLVVISHGGAAAYQVHADTAIALARAGFVAAAVSHAGDTWDDQSHVMELWRRPQQLHRLVSYMLEEWTGRGALDPKQVGAFGFSNGGFTVLVAAGGRPDLDRVGVYCQDHPDHDLCMAIKQAGFDPVHPPIHVPPNAWVPDGRIKAVVAAAPAFGYTFDRAGLSSVRVPVQLWRAADDRHQPHPYYEEAVRAALPGPADYHVVPLAGHFAFLPPCDERLAAAQPAICKDAPGFDRAAFHKAFNTEIVRFFRVHLAG